MIRAVRRDRPGTDVPPHWAHLKAYVGNAHVRDTYVTAIGVTKHLPAHDNDATGAGGATGRVKEGARVADRPSALSIW